MSGDRRVPKLCGADVELGNFILDPTAAGGSGAEAARALLREIHGHAGAGGTNDPQDQGRRYLDSNGGCVYIDLDHLECCLPEVRSAHEHVAAWHAMLRIVRRALDAAGARLPPGRTLHVLVNNSDGEGNAYGSHLSFLVSRRAWDDLFDRKLHHLLYLASFQVSSLIYTGQGKVGAENGRPVVGYQLSQRADFFEMLVGEQTTFRRPIVNARDEALCGRWRASTDGAGRPPAHDLARLHCIFFDNSLCHGSALLKVGTMQLVLALIEAGRVDPRRILEDPVAAVIAISHDPSLATPVAMLSGARLTALELQYLFLEDARHFEASGGFEGVVPRAGEILALWEDTLAKLAAGDLAALVPRLDWVLKLHALGQALAARPGLSWHGPEMKHLDQLYGSLDPEAGLYWGYEAAGLVERHVGEEAIARFLHTPPADTRAWGRAMLLRAAAAQGRLHDVDWDRLAFRERTTGTWPLVRTLEMADPLGFDEASLGETMRRATSFDALLDALGAAPPVIDPGRGTAEPAIHVVLHPTRKEEDDHAGT